MSVVIVHARTGDVTLSSDGVFFYVAKGRFSSTALAVAISPGERVAPRLKLGLPTRLTSTERIVYRAASRS